MKRWFIVIGVSLLAAGAIGVLLYHALGGSSVTRNMARADRHSDVVAPLLAREARFVGIQLHVYDGLGGSMSVNGTVLSEEDLIALHTLVESTRPPVNIYWRVATRPATQP